jgi:glycosyltransferase involved in cell wall biosynthesis
MEPSKVEVRRFKYVWSDALCLVGHARSLYGDVRLKNLVYLLMPLFMAAAFFHLLVLTIRYRFDVVQAHWVLPNGLIAALVAKLRSVPLVISLHGSDVYVAERNRLFGWLARLAFQWSCYVTACSQDLLDRAVVLGLDPQKAEVIPYGVDLERFVPEGVQETRAATLRERLGLNAGDVVVGSMGRLVYKKGFEYLIRAMPDVLTAFPHGRLVVAGEGDLKPELAQLAAELGISEKVLLPGHISWEDVPAYLSLCELFVVPSAQDHQGNVDGLPNVLLEAMAAGRSIVASRVAGIPAVVRTGVNGILVPQKDPRALSHAMCCLLRDIHGRRALGDAARAYAQSRLGWPAVSQRVADVLAAALEAGKREQA